MKTREREKDSRDSIGLMLLILLFGFICIILSSGWALRFALNWNANSNMGSNLNPDNEFLTSRPVGFFEPLDPSILTNPAWMDVFLTPGASFNTPVPPRPSPTGTFTPLPLSTSTSSTSNPTRTQTSLPTSIVILTATRTKVPSTSGPTATRTATGVVPPTFTFTASPTSTRTNTPTATATATSTATFTATATATFTATATATPTPTNTPSSSADLQITKTDNATDYAGGVSVQYIIVVSNPVGPSGVTGATVTDNFSAALTGITWTCSISGSATCTAVGAGNINDTVNLAVGSSITYTVNATVISSPPPEPLVNTATVSVPAGITDPNTLNNSAADTDQLIVANPIPGNIGNIPAGSYADYTFGIPPLMVTGDPTYDLVYYPDPTAPTLQVDAVILQISDGSNWYTIFNWGNASQDGNTDLPPNSPNCIGEPDNCLIDPLLLTNSPGISINVDLPGIPVGNYPYIRIISPPNPPDTGNDGVDVNTITLLP